MTRRRGRRWIIGLLILLAAPAGFLGYRRFEARRRVASILAKVPKLAGEAERVVPGIYYLGRLEPSAAYAVEVPGGLVLIDSGLDGDAGLLRAELRRVGLDWRKVRAIFLTHAHGDHCGGAEFLRALTRAKVYAGRDDEGPIEAGGPRDAIFSTFPMPGRVPRPTTVDVPLGGGEAFNFGDVRITAIATPGHTPGSTCYLVERDGLRIFFSGDVIMKLKGEPAPRYALDEPLGTYSTYLAPRYRGDAATYLATLRKLEAMAGPDLLLPGHPRADPAPESPALAPGRWEAILSRGVAEMEALVARRAVDGDRFLDGRAKPLLPGLDYLGDRGESAVYLISNSGRSFLIDAPGGPGLFGFARDAMAQLGRPIRGVDAVLLTGVDAAETSGLADLIASNHPLVVAPPAGIDRARELCPAGTAVIAAGDLAARGWLDATPIPLRGRGSAPSAYRIGLGGKSILASGRIPIEVTQDSGVALFEDFRAGRGDAAGYLESIDRLRRVTPDLWLPARPVDGQDAGLGPGRWARTLDDNRSAIGRNLGSLGGDRR